MGSIGVADRTSGRMSRWEPREYRKVYTRSEAHKQMVKRLKVELRKPRYALECRMVKDYLLAGEESKLWREAYVADIAEVLGVTASAVRKALVGLEQSGVLVTMKDHPSGGRSPALLWRIWEMAEAGETMSMRRCDIARALGADPDAVGHAIRRLREMGMVVEYAGKKGVTADGQT